MRLFIGNLPYSATEADLESWFGQIGVTVDGVNVVRDKFSGEARGFGFVDVADNDLANRAIEALNGRELMGRSIIVNEARPMERRAGTGGGGGRPGGGGGRGRDFGGGGGGRGRDRY
ncbi:MAG: RNA-binding protein [Bryobacteraceae bacterium]|nr:RNA-binding protein [Bryobacteraceae bacterium]